MKSVTICGSMKFASQMNAWGDFLKAQGVTVHVPDLVGNEEWVRSTTEEKRHLAHTLAINYFKRIKSCDVVFVFNENGYVGPSVTLEMGVAIALNKPMYAKHPDAGEVCRDVWFNGYCSTKEELLEILQT